MSAPEPLPSAQAAAPGAPLDSVTAGPETADLERRFGGLRRLYGDAGYRRIRQARVAVVGLGGVGSWAAEALARSGVAALVLIDLDHVAESNINRQVQALGATLGMAKGLALQQRIADIHPGCEVLVVEEFVDAQNWPALLPAPVDVLIDACDQVRAKLALAQWALAQAVPLVCVGAAGGKRLPQAVEVAELAQVTHDPLLASLRQRLRQAERRVQSRVAQGVAQGRAWADEQADEVGAAQGIDHSDPPARQRPVRWPLRCVFSREAVQTPDAVCVVDGGLAEMAAAAAPAESAAPATTAVATDGSLNCHGYGSSVTVTATFGMVAAAEALSQLLAAPRRA